MSVHYVSLISRSYMNDLQHVSNVVDHLNWNNHVLYELDLWNVQQSDFAKFQLGYGFKLFWLVDFIPTDQSRQWL